MLDRTEVGQSVDVLAEILDTVHVQSADVQLLQVDVEVKLESLERAEVVILVVLSGRCFGNFGGYRIEMGEGDAHALLRGVAGDGVLIEPPPRESGIEGLRSQGIHDNPSTGGGVTTLLHCACHFADPERNPLLGAMPRSLHVGGAQWEKVEWLSPTVRWIEREAAAKSPGAKTVINRLVELLWVQLVRTHIATTPVASHGWLRALSDAQIGSALCLIHENPASPFTVAGLAQAVGMSRSAFASQFSRLVGEPPLHYIARWRMLKASELLKEDRQSLAEVALAVGYDSEAAFSKAFKRWSGQAPGAYRREQRSSEPPTSARLLAG